MNLQLKPIPDQTMVITGASSGIGLATARLAAKEGARLVLAARNGEALDLLVKEIRDAGGEASAVVADVRDPGDVHEIARIAGDAFGGFNTWINNAGVSIYGTIEEVAIEDMRQLFETNFWGARLRLDRGRRHAEGAGRGTFRWSMRRTSWRRRFSTAPKPRFGTSTSVPAACFRPFSASARQALPTAR